MSRAEGSLLFSEAGWNSQQNINS